MPGTVLCVDNDRELVQILAKALEGEGYRVLSAYDGERALELAAGEQPDLVLLDLILPRRDGFAVLEGVRTLPGEAARMPVVLLSGCTPTREYQSRAESLGAAAFLTKPVPLDRLLEVVAGQIKRGAAGRPEGPAPELSGELESLPFASLLHHLRGLRATGVLHLSEGKRLKWLELRDGRPTAVLSNLVSECLGNFLVRTGRISRGQLEESRRRMSGGALQGEILVAMDVLSENDIPAVLRAQAEEKLLEIFSWNSGRYRLEAGGRLQRANELTLDRSVANLILDGVRERMPVSRVDEWLRQHTEALVHRAESPFYRYQEIDLAGQDLKLIRSLERSRPVAELLAGDEGRRRSLYGLLATGMLELAGRPASADAPPSRRRAAEVRREAPRRTEDPEQRAELVALAERLRRADPFDALEVSPSAPDAEIRESYERLLGAVHPDRVRSSGVERLAQQIRAQLTQAFETLADPARRTAFQLERRRKEREHAARDEARAALEAEREFQAGEAALRQRDYKTAVTRFANAVERFPEAGEYHAHYGWALHLDDPQSEAVLAQAIGHVRKGLKLASESEKSYLYLGRLLNVAGRTDVAEKMFTRAVQIRPECTEALREIRLIHMRRKNSKGIVQRLLRR